MPTKRTKCPKLFVEDLVKLPGVSEELAWVLEKFQVTHNLKKSQTLRLVEVFNLYWVTTQYTTDKQFENLLKQTMEMEIQKGTWPK